MCAVCNEDKCHPELEDYWEELSEQERELALSIEGQSDYCPACMKKALKNVKKIKK